MSIITAALYAIIPFSIIMWLSIFLNTSKHFEDKKEKIKTGIFNATVITLSITAMIILALVIILKKLNL